MIPIASTLSILMMSRRKKATIKTSRLANKNIIMSINIINNTKRDKKFTNLDLLLFSLKWMKDSLKKMSLFGTTKTIKKLLVQFLHIIWIKRCILEQFKRKQKLHLNLSINLLNLRKLNRLFKEIIRIDIYL